MTRYAVTMLIAGLLLAAAPAPKEEDDAKQFQGVWQAVSYEANGVDQKDVADKVVCTCEKDVFTFKYDGKVVWKATVKLSPSKKPRTIDLTITEGSNKGQTILGIYEVDKDALKWCTAGAGQTERPTDFASQVGSDVALYTFKREKP
jgi:uncharacterized protein (TIGR03067 family)